MLVVTRKVGESIIIRAGKDTITVSVEAVHGSNVRIGLGAPSHVQILRNELIQNHKEFDKVSDHGSIDSGRITEDWRQVHWVR